MLCAVGVLFLSDGVERQRVSSLDISPGTVDLGNVSQGTSCVRTTVSNIGSGDLDILYVTKGCDCTSAKITKGLLKPGEKRDLEVEWDTRGRRGNDKTEIGVIFLRKGSDKKEATWFSISSRVIPEFDVSPDRLECDQNTSQTFTVSIISEKNAYRIVDTQINHPAFMASVSEEGDSAKVTFSSEKWQEGFGPIRMTLKTDCEGEPEFRVPIILKRNQ